MADLHGYLDAQKDNENGLYDMGARKYDARHGRFLTPDPLAELEPSADAYGYCGGNPVMFSDRSGLFSQVVVFGNNSGGDGETKCECGAEMVETDAGRKCSKRCKANTGEGNGGGSTGTVFYGIIGIGTIHLGSLNFENSGSHISGALGGIAKGSTGGGDAVPKSMVTAQSQSANISVNRTNITVSSGTETEVGEGFDLDVAADILGLEPTGIVDFFHSLTYLPRGEFFNFGVTILGVFGTDALKGLKYVGKAGAKGLWKLTSAGATSIKEHNVWGKFFKGADGLWWSLDKTGHGASVFKVFKGGKKGLEWIHNADKYGDFIKDQHKSPTGTFIPWGELRTIK